MAENTSQNNNSSWTSNPAIYASGGSLLGFIYIAKKVHDQNEEIEEMKTTIKSLTDQLGEFRSLINKQEEGRRHLLKEKGVLENEVRSLKENVDMLKKFQERTHHDNYHLKRMVADIHQRSLSGKQNSEHIPQRVQAISPDDVSDSSSVRNFENFAYDRGNGNQMSQPQMSQPQMSQQMSQPQMSQPQMSQRFFPPEQLMYPPEQLMYPPEGYSREVQYRAPSQKAQEDNKQPAPVRYPSIGNHLDALGSD